MPASQPTHAIGFSRILGFRDAMALGMSLSVPLVLVVMHRGGLRRGRLDPRPWPISWPFLSTYR